jgi:hypothetical protein
MGALTTPTGPVEEGFPWLLKWQVKFRAHLSKKDWSEGGLDESDLMGQGFSNLLAQLREVLLQDLACYSPVTSFASPPIYYHFHPLFSCTESPSGK